MPLNKETLHFELYSEYKCVKIFLTHTYWYDLKVFDFLHVTQGENKCLRVALAVPQNKYSGRGRKKVCIRIQLLKSINTNGILIYLCLMSRDDNKDYCLSCPRKHSIGILPNNNHITYKI